ncbi:MAG TPA: bifunctional phosphopantothenoylcysteine decarboxylase/phosphopantothenate--cysteine ligase CoaBC [Sulfurimonas sp.]|nr:bifunctional phosphopantothenoylcysteine decarboxylase/phosphopantothenate--cysteine ligase CoaBC [Sulfurimonas sp.]
MFPDLLRGKKILLAVTGSISVYKSLELIRLYIKSGAEVRVLMSESAKKFITPLTFETISMNKVLHNETESWDNDLNHIKIGDWADAFVIAPASANTIAKLSQGISDNLLLQTALAYAGEKLLCPAANTNMINNPIISLSMQNLALCNYTIMDTQTKLLACNTKGDGALIDIEEIYFKTVQMLLKEEFWENRSVIVSAGGSIEKIDDVRYLSNFSSGKMGSSLALALFFKGADVSFVSSKFPLRLPILMKQIEVHSSKQMKEELDKSLVLLKNSELKPFVFMAAAVSDYIPHATSGKLKKTNIGEDWSLELKQNVDILASLDKENVFSIGFKAEMDEKSALGNAEAMLKKKDLDAVCLNLLKDDKSFGTQDNAIEFLTKTGQVSLPSQDKLSLSLALLELCKSL